MLLSPLLPNQVTCQEPLSFFFLRTFELLPGISMESFLISKSGLKPLPRICIRPITGLVPRNYFSKPRFLHTSKCFSDLKVTTPLKVASVEEDEEINERMHGINKLGEQEQETRFDPAAPPPFNLADVRASIPQHCWVKDPWKSMSYVVRDVALVLSLAAAVVYVNNWLVWPLYWVAQGTMFWALFVLGHDCGHGSFSNNPKLNSLVGHLLHSSILVPYHGWRISHRIHHQNQGHVENDESWHPWGRSPGKTGSHFDPNSELFVPSERKDVITSSLCWTAMAAILVGLGFTMGLMLLLKLYGVPYWEWSYLRGGLTTLDRDYGWMNNIHHDIGTHVIHHLFPQIPHYRLIEATKAAKPVLGKYYREPERSRPLPFHLIGVFIRSLKEDHYVSDTGDVVYYQN
ncbi:hypothetical protein ES332_A01G266800v1 [Gossypium tomentosum]|uniref:Fatty acid desaturase domain-containing protein n=1 Tax=Gossypium tomentosum TaxID=34277 RepID=A0A5D2RVU8_GOSTO|nr:hypothetical protein ES332_A01G266800v1 [Gossypium tomentosum]